MYVRSARVKCAPCVDPRLCVGNLYGHQPADVQQLVSMGFDEADVRAALQQADNDVNRATNILLDGM